MFAIARKDGGGERLTVETAALMSACEKLSEGGRFPLDVQPIAATPAPMAMSVIGGTVVKDDAAKARIERQHAALGASGVDVDTSQQLYKTGDRMAAEGYARQDARKIEHDQQMPLRDASAALRAAVEAEHRKDVEVTAREFASALTVNGKVSAFGLTITEQAIRGLATRLEAPFLSYALGLRERIAVESYKGPHADVEAMQADKRALADVLQHECRQAGDTKLKLRTREGVGDVFAIVSPSYTAADAPTFTGLIEQGMPSDARGTWAYDPKSTKWELRANVWTPTPVEEQAVGEAFEGYVSFRSSDAGNGSLNGGGGVSLLRCLNASTYTAGGSEVRRTHRSRILVDVGRMLRDSLKAIHALCEAWGVARETELAVPSGVPINEAIPGFWRYCLTARGGELAGVLPGRSETHVTGLTRAFHAERRDPSKLVKADMAQGWTRYIQDQPSGVRRDAESAIGQWIANVSAVSCDLRK
jgi:hypothetical protein